MKHKYKEAFCHMRYTGMSSDGKIYVNVTIWNSRDGVAPLTFPMEGLGITAEYIGKSEYAPNYKPKPGDLIWRNWTEGEARSAARKTLQHYQDQVNKVPLDRLQEPQYKLMIEALTDRAKYSEETVQKLVGTFQPKIELIKEI